MNEKTSFDSQHYAGVSDEELAIIAANGDRKSLAELVSRYSARIRTRAFSFSKNTPDDFMQEGLLGFLSAVQTFDPSGEAKFSTYAMVCVKNRMISAYKKLSGGVDTVPQEDAEDIFDPAEIPENIVLERVSLEELLEKIYSQLSELEWRVFQMYLSGMNYNQISMKLSVNCKSVDNAMQRVRSKLKEILR